MILQAGKTHKGHMGLCRCDRLVPKVIDTQELAGPEKKGKGGILGGTLAKAKCNLLKGKAPRALRITCIQRERYHIHSIQHLLEILGISATMWLDAYITILRALEAG